jgi:hypothetical protein
LGADAEGAGQVVVRDAGSDRHVDGNIPRPPEATERRFGPGTASLGLERLPSSLLGHGWSLLRGGGSRPR